MVRKDRTGSSPVPGTLIPEGPVRTRLAPTPSGYLHAGNAVNFLVAWKLARQHRGQVLLRIDDLDAERTRPDCIDDIFRSLEWLGIDPDEGPTGPDDLRRSWSQHHRTARAVAYANTLRASGRLYACRCSRRQQASCSCRDAALDLDSEAVTWRLRSAPDRTVTFHTWPNGTRTVPLSTLLDPVLRQRGGRPAYQLASLADDVAWHIDVIVRGEDLLPSTACQVHLADLLGADAFRRARFVHHRLLRDASGAKLSKSEGALALKTLRERGSDPGWLHEAAERILQELDQAAGGSVVGG